MSKQAWVPILLAALFVMRCATPLAEARHDLASVLQDDAFYYLIPAANLAHGLGSSFDGISQTNGYHPLWFLILSGLAVLHVPAVGGAIGTGLVLDGIGLLVLVRIFRDQPAWLLLLAGGFFLQASFMMASLTGMENDALLACFMGFLAVIWECRERPRPLALGCCAALCILARIDAALFILPLVAAAPLTWRNRARAGAVVGAAMLVYALANLAWFGLPVPVSGAVKALGGMGLNHALVDQIAFHLALSADARVGFARWSTEPFVLYAMMVPTALALCVVLTGLARSLLLALLTGMGLFLVRQFFFSTWRLWPWYHYPVFIGGMVLCLAVGVARPWEAVRWRCGAALLVLLPLGFFAFFQGFAGTPMRLAIALKTDGFGSPHGRFALLNARAAEVMNQVAPGARVAMGDRAGSFAWHYSGHVVQLEGLMNDAAYFRVLKQGGDVRALLCARAVRYVLAYGEAYGDAIDLPTVRPALSGYPGYPSLRVQKADEVMALHDPGLYQGAVNGDQDDTIFAWRLSGCGSA